MPVPWLVRVHLEKLEKKLGKHKKEIEKWANEVGERIEQRIADAYKQMGCVAVVECYSMLLGEYSVVLTNSRKLVVKLGSQMCTCRKWKMTGLPCCHALVVIAKTNLWGYDFVHPIYRRTHNGTSTTKSYTQWRRMIWPLSMTGQVVLSAVMS